MLVFLEEGKKEVSRKKSLRARDRASNKPHIESTARIWTWTTFFGGDCSSHCATLAPLSINLNKSINYCSIFLLFSAISKPPDNTDECSTSPCQNSGTCVNRYNDYICQCADGYHGKNCETGERYIKERNERMFSPCPHESRHFQPQNFTWIYVNGALKRFGQRFQNKRFRWPDSLVS